MYEMYWFKQETPLVFRNSKK